MKHCISLLLIFSFTIPNLFAQEDYTQKLNSFFAMRLPGFERIKPGNVPAGQLKKGLKLARHYKYSEKSAYEYSDTIQYRRNDKGELAISFISKYYELTIVIVSKEGNWQQTISFLNPEYKPFNMVSDSVAGIDYSINVTSSPMSSVWYCQKQEGNWFEVEAYKNEYPANMQLLKFNKDGIFIKFLEN